jgi:predicted amidophosphoribosyltransferase
MAAGNFKWNRVFSFSQLFCLFLGKKNPVRSVFVINVSLFTSVVCYCQNGLRRKHGKCSLCNEWWHSFRNQRLNHLVFCIKSVTLEGLCNKNVDIIWHYCIIQFISQFLKTISSHKYEERRIEIYDK